jgi:diguanylate cyclase (GGDEF)-like protein
MKFGAKLALIFWVCTIGITSIAAMFFYQKAMSAIRAETNARVADVALAASTIVDAGLHSRIKTQADETDKSYLLLKEKLKRFRISNPKIRHVYTLVPGDSPNTLKYVMDVGVLPSVTAHVGCTWNVSDRREVLKAFKGAVVDTKVTRDAWGNWLSGYAPIKDSKGNTVGIVGVDVSVDHLTAIKYKLRRGAYLAMLTAALLATVLSLTIAAKVSQPIMRLTNIMGTIADGNLECTIPITGSDEFAKMASCLSRMVANLRANHAILLQRANTDGLTGLYNHRYFQERLNQELKRAARYNHPLSLLMIDLNGFKAVNDTLGHPAGDTILRNFANTLIKQIRDTDIAARYGGDEFAVILPETELEEAKEIAERISKAVDMNPHLSDDPTLSAPGSPTPDWKISVSIGIASYPTHAAKRDAIIAAADIAMYHAKHVLRKPVCVYDSVPGAGSSMDPCRIHTFLQSANVSTIAALATAVDAKDHYTHGHSEAVARYAVAIAQELRCSQEEQFNVRIAALLHDVGKIGVPDSILTNPGTLDEREMDIVHNHPSVGEQIVKQVPQLQKILPGILYHHERWDGKGYPCGLSGPQIPLIARIICVADAFDAMTSDRPYRKALSMDQAIQDLKNNMGRQFDPACVDALLRWLRANETAAA